LNAVTDRQSPKPWYIRNQTQLFSLVLLGKRLEKISGRHFGGIEALLGERKKVFQ
jgi:hypothetical protein